MWERLKAAAGAVIVVVSLLLRRFLWLYVFLFAVGGPLLAFYMIRDGNWQGVVGALVFSLLATLVVTALYYLIHRPNVTFRIVVMRWQVLLMALVLFGIGIGSQFWFR